MLVGVSSGPPLLLIRSAKNQSTVAPPVCTVT